MSRYVTNSSLVLLLFVVFALNLTLIAPSLPISFSLDEVIILDMIYFGRLDVGFFSSYGNVAYFYSLLPEFFLSDFFNSFLVLLCLSFLIVKTKNHAAGMLIAALSVFLFIYMGRVCKDIFILLLLTIFYLFRSRSYRVVLGMFVLMYFSYALFFRGYYFLILGVFFMLPLLLRRPVLTCLILFLFLLLTPSWLYEYVYSARMDVNLNRFYSSDVRTIIMSPSSMMNVVGFLINYLYSVVVIMFPFFYGLKAQDLLVFAINWSLFFLIIRTMNRRKVSDQKAFKFENLLISHVIVMFIFEPDLGSFFRHILVLLPVVVVCMEVSDFKFPSFKLS